MGRITIDGQEIGNANATSFINGEVLAENIRTDVRNTLRASGINVPDTDFSDLDLDSQGLFSPDGIDDGSITLENITIDQPTAIGSTSRVIINGEEITKPTLSISDAGLDSNIQVSYQDENGSEIFGFTRPQAELNIFAPGYYANNNPDVAQSLEGRYQDANFDIDLQTAQLPQLAPFGSIQFNVAGTTRINIIDSTGNIISSEDINNPIVTQAALIEHYVSNGVNENRDPSPFFDSKYYLEQNPDVASALTVGSFEGDPLLHYVSAGAEEGRDPNPYFDTSYYLEQNPDAANSDLNPLEHYVLFGSSARLDPSPNFDPNFYLNQNPDVATAGIDPLTHFLTFGEDEGRLPVG